MSQGTRSKVSAHGKHQVDSDTDDTIQLSNEKESSTVISQTNPSLKLTHPAPPTMTGSKCGLKSSRSFLSAFALDQIYWIINMGRFILFHNQLKVFK